MVNSVISNPVHSGKSAPHSFGQRTVNPSMLLKNTLQKTRISVLGVTSNTAGPCHSLFNKLWSDRPLSLNKSLYLYVSEQSCNVKSDMENYFSPPGEAAMPMAPPSAPSPIDTSSGFDPDTVPRPSLTRKAKVLYDYDAAEKNELSLLADEVSVRAET